MSKGSRARPFEVDQDHFADAWERTFGKKNKVEESDKKDIKEESDKEADSSETK